jgi:RNA polymerase sigma-70 factor (ECF subfamily)
MFLKPNTSPAADADIVGVEHIDGLYSYALVLSRNRSEAEDLVQETYVRALGAMGRLRPESNVKSWLFTILRNIWLNQLRQRRTAPQIVEMDVEGINVGTGTKTADDDPYALYVSTLERNQVREAIQQLPAESREIILLREFEELSYQEIATILGCPAGTVMSRLARARAKLRALLSATLLTAVQDQKEVIE